MTFLKVKFVAKYIKKLSWGPFGDYEKFSKKKRMRILKKSHSAKKFKRGDSLGFFKFQFAARYQKFEGGDKKIRKKVAQCQKIQRGTLFPLAGPVIW